MIDHDITTRSLLLFLGLAYGSIWGLFGLGKWLAIPFSMDPMMPGGLFYIIGMLVDKSGGSIFPAILFHEGANYMAFNFRWPGSNYGSLVWVLAAGMAVFWLPRPWWQWPWKAAGPAAAH